MFAAEVVDSAELSPELCSLDGVLVATDMVELLLCALVASGAVWLGVSVATDAVEPLLWVPAVIFALWLSLSVADVAARRLARSARCDRPNMGGAWGLCQGSCCTVRGAFCARCRCLMRNVGSGGVCYGNLGHCASRLPADIAQWGP